MKKKEVEDHINTLHKAVGFLASQFRNKLQRRDQQIDSRMDKIEDTALDTARILAELAEAVVADIESAERELEGRTVFILENLLLLVDRVGIVEKRLGEEIKCSENV